MQIPKRVKFGIVSVVLSLGFASTLFLADVNRIYAIVVLGVLTLVLFFWALREGLGKNATLLTLVLPVCFSLGVGLFWFLLPVNLLARIPIILIYSAGIYALCLTSNIYTVSAIRTIALQRAAKGVGFVMTLFTSFLLFDTILSLRQPVYVNFFLVFLISFPLILQSLWVIPLSSHVSKKLFIYTSILSLIMAQISMLLYFWPVKVVVGSLFLTTVMYILLGLAQAKLEGRLFTQTIREYLVVGVVVFVGMFLATTWGG